jgi:hypothetical protein
MIEMKKVVKAAGKVVLLFISLVVAGFVKERLEAFYAERWNCVSGIAILAIFILWLSLAFERVNKYQLGAYLWDKLLGKKEQTMETALLAEQIIPVCVCMVSVTSFGTQAFVGTMTASGMFHFLFKI